jgi:DNA-binding IclR family transcriptional regulator
MGGFFPHQTKARLHKSEVDMNTHALPAHLLLLLVRIHSENRRASLETLVEELSVRRADVRRTLSTLHREGFVDVLRMRPTLAGFALGRALRGVELPALRAPKVAAIAAA